MSGGLDEGIFEEAGYNPNTAIDCIVSQEGLIAVLPPDRGMKIPTRSASRSKLFSDNH